MPGEDSQGNREQSDQQRRSEEGEQPPARAVAQAQPASEPDVFLDVPQVKVEDFHLEVEHLDAHVSLRARLANLLELDVGVQARLGKVKIDIKEVETRALLKVRLQVVHEILARALATIDQNPQVLENLAKTAQQTLGPQGPVTRTVEQVGRTDQQTLGPSGTATQAVNQVGGGRGSLQRAVAQLRNSAQRALHRLGKTAKRGSKKGR